jgi:hypothetical protein
MIQSQTLTLVAATGARRPKRSRLARQARSRELRATIRARPLRARDLLEVARERAVAYDFLREDDL